MNLTKLLIFLPFNIAILNIYVYILHHLETNSGLEVHRYTKYLGTGIQSFYCDYEILLGHCEVFRANNDIGLIHCIISL